MHLFLSLSDSDDDACRDEHFLCSTTHKRTRVLLISLTRGTGVAFVRAWAQRRRDGDAVRGSVSKAPLRPHALPAALWTAAPNPTALRRCPRADPWGQALLWFVRVCVCVWGGEEG